VPGGQAVDIRSGRPNISELLADLPAGYPRGSFLGVWTAGPKAFNEAVSNAAHKCGKRVDVHQMAFEL
jgi:hypothetical protein